MTQTLSVRLNASVKKRLENLAAESKRSESFLAAKAIAAYVDIDEWQRREIAEGIKDLDAGRIVSHEEITRDLRKWGRVSKPRQ